MSSVQDLQFEPSWYNKLVKNSSEKELLILKLGQILEGKKTFSTLDSILEVGMGTSPSFSTKLAPLVSKYKIVEKEPYAKPLPKNTQIIIANFEESLLTEKFDAIILSHVIYYFSNLNKAIEKALNLLNFDGSAFFVVNGPGKHYGPLKKAFSKITNTPFEFTYHKLLDKLKSLEYSEYTLETSIFFKSYEDLYESLRLFFDLYPEEFNFNSSDLIFWLKKNVSGNHFIMEQKIIEVFKR